MWFHLLSVAALIAVDSCLGSCKRHMGFRTVDPACNKDDCPCDCPLDTCTPCPIPIPPECLDGCGAPYCPCPKAENTTVNHEKQMARGVSTINVYPTGPICSGVSIALNKTLTVCSCVLGKPLHQLYVTVNTKPTIETLKVRSVLIGPLVDKEPSLCVLSTDEAKHDLPIYGLPKDFDNELVSIEYHKWEVVDFGRAYKPTRTEAPLYTECKIDGKNRLCVEAGNVTTMGWNDIGTPFVEVVDHTFTLYGLYYGSNLYKDIETIEYLPLMDYIDFLHSIFKQKSH